MYLSLLLPQRYKKVLTYAIGNSLFVSRDFPTMYLHILLRAPRHNGGPSRLFTGVLPLHTDIIDYTQGVYYVLQYVLQIGISLLQVSKKMLIFAAGLG